MAPPAWGVVFFDGVCVWCQVIERVFERCRRVLVGGVHRNSQRGEERRRAQEGRRRESRVRCSVNSRGGLVLGGRFWGSSGLGVGRGLRDPLALVAVVWIRAKKFAIEVGDPQRG